MTILELQSLSFAWPGKKLLWQNVSLTLESGESTGLMGPNGSGKTTLFRCITGLAQVKSGSIVFNGKAVAAERDFHLLRRHTGFALQHAEEQLIFPEVVEDVCFGPLNLGLRGSEARERAMEALELLGISHLAGRQTFELSGGEQRLAALAGLLAMRPQLLLLDEPLTGLDEAAAARLISLLHRLPCAKIIAAHDAPLLHGVCSGVYTLTPAGLCSLE